MFGRRFRMSRAAQCELYKLRLSNGCSREGWTKCEVGDWSPLFSASAQAGVARLAFKFKESCVVNSCPFNLRTQR